MSEFGTLGVIGSGSIAKAIVRGLLDSERVSRDKIMVSGRNLSSLTSLAEKFNVRVTNNNAECILQSDVIVLAVKPQDFAQVVPALRYNIKQTQIILSVMAGISIETIRKTIGIEKILRVMPTIAVSHRQGVLVWTSSSDLSDSEREKTKRLLSLLGKEIYVEDDNMLDL